MLGRLEELSELLRRVDSPALGVCLDTNVMSTWGDSIPRWFERLGEHTGLVRLCDGNYHGWRAWGEGVLPMERYRAELEAAGYAGRCPCCCRGSAMPAGPPGRRSGPWRS